MNLRLDPFEKMGLGDSLFAANWWAYEFWRFVFVQQEVAKLAQTADAARCELQPLRGQGADRKGNVQQSRELSLMKACRASWARLASNYLYGDVRRLRPQRLTQVRRNL